MLQKPSFRVFVSTTRAVKLYGPVSEVEERYSQSRIKGTKRKDIIDNPHPVYISTSCEERQHLTMRMSLSMRRFTRPTNAFSKRVENLTPAVSLHFTWYNFGRIQGTLRVTPTMEAGVTHHHWRLGEIGRVDG